MFLIILKIKLFKLINYLNFNLKINFIFYLNKIIFINLCKNKNQKLNFL